MNTETKTAETIDLTPTWEQATTLLLAVIERGETAKAKQDARDELRVMGRMADLTCPLANVLAKLIDEWKDTDARFPELLEARALLAKVKALQEARR